MNKIATITTVALLSSVAFPALAQDRGFYLGGELGAAFSTDMDLSFTPGATAGSEGSIDVGHDLGVNASLIAGYDFGPIRLEAEAAHFSAGIKDGTSDWAHGSGLVAGGQTMDGSVRTRTLMANIVLDLGRQDDFSFFIGAGAGSAELKVSEMALQSGAVLLDDGAGSRFAWQAFAGIRRPLSTNLEGHVRYRYLNIDDGEMIGLGGRVVNGGISSHAVVAGITYRFW